MSRLKFKASLQIARQIKSWIFQEGDYRVSIVPNHTTVPEDRWGSTTIYSGVNTVREYNNVKESYPLEE